MKFLPVAFAVVVLFSAESHADTSWGTNWGTSSGKGKGKGSKSSKGGKGKGSKGSKYGKGKGGAFCPAECIDWNRDISSYSYSYYEEHDLYIGGYLECCLDWPFFAGIEYRCTGLGGGFMSIMNGSGKMYCCPNDCVDQVYNRRNCYGPFYWDAATPGIQPPPPGCVPPPAPTPTDPTRALSEERLLSDPGLMPPTFCAEKMGQMGKPGPWIEVVVASGPARPKWRKGRGLEGHGLEGHELEEHELEGRELGKKGRKLGCSMWIYCCKNEEATD